MENFEIVEVTPDNVNIETLFCIKDVNNPGFARKRDWFTERYKEGLCLWILKNQADKSVAFIEFLPANIAWRPVEAPNFLFIQCMFTYSNQDKRKGFASKLIQSCEQHAIANNFHGICAMTSKGSWIMNNSLFLKNGYSITDRRGRFELLAKKLNTSAPDPVLLDWTLKQREYQGWHLIYADQCPWHEKSVQSIQAVANEYGIKLKIRKLLTAQEAKNAPSGYGVFSLLKDGNLIEDHYLSETRFRNILKAELKRD